MADRYDLVSLIRASGLTYDHAREQVGASGRSWTVAARDGLSELVADRWAVKLGLVPPVVWPGWLADVEQECAAPDCTERFVPKARASHQKWCSNRCRSRIVMRRLRSTPEGFDLDKRRQRQYRADVRAMTARRQERRAS